MPGQPNCPYGMLLSRIRSQQQPLLPQASRQEKSSWSGPSRDLVKVLSIGASTIVVSAALITFNKHLMSPGRFPYAASLVLLHMTFSTVVSLILRFVAPGLLPAANQHRQ
eukprot:gnl/TRDRNA2_/TRDRNA2_91107_c1_seq1.p1 gnl/TRDRNA2_/TRDRNA2_91107_c1~~gnl/TRDRNA2_/TRDRNA2_91107_c1_seq1.p1  ORF type:complete len:110 (+),score=12.01 gnl/TRDRNA2_/TRDRNA2_91107_c1_seq1:125-454(+)